ncbi:MAG: uracil-DNA glycosylase [Opitutales bacterium]|nr:uracil-DNA glycosylase [Opitutales bacterium]NRA28401.1 uracil-DNA glycosylase [Opitutales bacterium]
MREAIEALVMEFKQLKRSGEEHVLLAPERLQSLQDAVSHMATHPAEEGKESRPLLKVTRRDQEGPSVFEQSMQDKASLVQEQAPRLTPSESAFPAPPSIELPDGSKQEQWDWLKERVLSCPVCDQNTPRGKRIVYGVGSLDAEVFLCGEAPGADETVKGEPFVGPAGQLLDKIMATAGWTRDELYVGNIMNWRPDTGKRFGNRPPTSEELAFCLPYLKAQVAIVKPKVIIALGKTAVKGLLFGEDNFSLGRVHGQWHEFEGIPVMPTYHPSYLLHNGTNQAKRMVWEDIMQVMEKLGRSISERQRGYFL